MAPALRKRVLKDSIFHGWPPDWVKPLRNFEDEGIVQDKEEEGYRVRRISYEIVPGFWTSAILYEPKNMKGKVPAILVFEGHNQGDHVPYNQQILSINFARMGMLALNPVLFNKSQHPWNDHWYGSHLNLAGVSATGLIYLAARKALDYLADHNPNVDTRACSLLLESLTGSSILFSSAFLRKTGSHFC